MSEPIPWSTGLPVALYAAVLAGLGDVAFVSAIADVAGSFWVPANLVACLGVAPGLWLLRRVPFWRWPALGAAAGLAVAWLALLVRVPA